MPMPLRRSSGNSAKALRMCRARMCGKDLAKVLISLGGMPSAAPTSRIACRTRYVSRIETQVVRLSPNLSKIA